MDKNVERKPSVSVVMSCYNSEKYVFETIESVLNQTYSNFEFIIWDDGSIDNTRAIVQSFTDKRIRYFFHENTGLGGALKLACQEARGKYIARIDADDVCMPNRLERQVRFLENHNDYVLVSSAVYLIDSQGNNLGRNYPYTDARIIRELLCYSNPISHPASFFRRSSYLQTTGYQNIWGCEDLLLWKQFNKIGKIGNLAEPLIKYRLDQASIMHQKYNHPYRDVMLALTKKILNDGGTNEYDNSLLLEFKNNTDSNMCEQSLFYGESRGSSFGKRIKALLGNHCGSLIIFLKNMTWYVKRFVTSPFKSQCIL